MSRIRVLLLLYSVEPAGAEKVVLSLAKHIDRDKFTPVVCSLRGGRLLNEFLSLEIPVYILHKKKGLDISIVWKLLRILRAERIEIIHSHNFSPNFWGRVVGKIAGIPVLIATEHTVANVKTGLQKTVDYILSKITDKIITVSNRVRDSHVKEEGILSEKFVTIYNGVEPWDSDEKAISAYKHGLLKELGILPGDSVITTIGRLEPPKGYENLLKAIPRVTGVFPQSRFLIVGDGHLKTNLENLAGKLGIREQVIFAGFRNDIRDILAVTDLCVIPSIREGFSVTLLEAMSAGRPIIATDVGGNAEAITDGETGIIVQPGDHLVLADKIIAVLKDKRFAKEMGAKAQKRFKEFFTLQKMIDETENLYQSLSQKIS